MRINYTSKDLETIVLDVPWDEGFIPPPQIVIYVETSSKYHVPVTFHHRGDRPIQR